jgi:hypothetical protein
MQPRLDNRTFLVGCGRSGTTLLASLLSAHPQIRSFPETAFFLHLVGQITSRAQGREVATLKQSIARPISAIRIGLGIAHPASLKNVEYFCEKINRPDLLKLYPGKAISLRQHVDACVKILDTLCLEEGKHFWVEKTPKHLGYIDVIERYITPVKFIHMLRNGPDVVASYTDAGQKFPEGFWQEYQSLDLCIRRWNHSVQTTILHMAKPNHYVMTYQKLVADTPGTLKSICQFLEVDYDARMLSDYQTASAEIIGGEAWKSNASDEIYDANSTKYYQLFDDKQRQYIEDKLIKVDIEELGR